MPMDVLTLVQTIEIFTAYLFVTAGLPAFVFGKKLNGHRMTERFLIYYTIGNFYVINLVYLLQLLKISYPITLALGTFVPAVWGRLVLNKTPVRKIVQERLEFIRKLNAKSMGRRTARLRLRQAIGRRLSAAGRSVGRLLLHKMFDCLLVLAFLALLCWLHGVNLLGVYGYKASDLPVHNYWINAMGENHIFVAGVYPFGFHCVLYYLHAVFRFDTYNVLRIFGFVQAVMAHLILLLFLRLCCRSKYAAYAGAFIYAGSMYFAGSTYSRFYSALPQEFGMIFILPAVYFGFGYFEARRRELAKEQEEKPEKWRIGRWLKKRKDAKQTAEDECRQAEPPGGGKKRGHGFKGICWRKSHLYLAGFAMSFSMTLTIHFYGTMIAGLFALAMAVGYGFLFFRKKYFWNIVVTCVLSVVIAALPMVIAYLGGTPLQGSLGWGMNVIKASQESSDTVSGDSDSEMDIDESTNSAEGGQADLSPSGGALQEVGGTASDPPVPEPQPQPSVKERLQTLIGRAVGAWEKLRSTIFNALSASVLRLPDTKYINWVIYGFAALIALGILLFLLRQRCYGAMLISTGIYMFLMGIMMSARTFGLPALMDANRGSIYFAYSLPLVLSFLVDAVLVLLFLPFKHKLLMYALSLASVLFVVWHTWDSGQLREPRSTGAFETNEAITCMENIIAIEQDFMWTIVSANDELRMGTDHGYHYETITFLEDMEGVEDWSEIQIRIPTPVVYIFIEKIPIDYATTYAESGQAISEEGAAHPLPPSIGIRMYQGEQRWIVMSRIYYWAQEFIRLYPNEMDVFLETDQFVCYRIEQNTYRLYDFAIDYGYNTRDYQAAEG